MKNEKTYNWRTDYRIVLGHEVPCVVAGKCCGMVWSAWNKGSRPPVACPMCGAKIVKTYTDIDTHTLYK